MSAVYIYFLCYEACVNVCTIEWPAKLKIKNLYLCFSKNIVRKVVYICYYVNHNHNQEIKIYFF